MNGFYGNLDSPPASFRNHLPLREPTPPNPLPLIPGGGHYAMIGSSELGSKKKKTQIEILIPDVQIYLFLRLGDFSIFYL